MKPIGKIIEPKLVLILWCLSLPLFSCSRFVIIGLSLCSVPDVFDSCAKDTLVFSSKSKELIFRAEMLNPPRDAVIYVRWYRLNRQKEIIFEEDILVGQSGTRKYNLKAKLTRDKMAWQPGKYQLELSSNYKSLRRVKANFELRAYQP